MLDKKTKDIAQQQTEATRSQLQGEACSDVMLKHIGDVKVTSSGEVNNVICSKEIKEMQFEWTHVQHPTIEVYSSKVTTVSVLTIRHILSV